MKPLLSFVLAVSLLTFSRAPLPAGEAPATAKCVLKLEPEIDCPSCEDGIKHSLMTAHGVQDADIDVLNNRITVRYNPASTNVKALVGRIKVFGYTATETK